MRLPSFKFHIGAFKLVIVIERLLDAPLAQLLAAGSFGGSLGSLFSNQYSRAFVHARNSEDVKRDPIALVPDVPDLSAPVS